MANQNIPHFGRRGSNPCSGNFFFLLLFLIVPLPFAFVVPARAGRKKPAYGKESELVAPISRYMPNTMRAWLFSGMPTILLDEYDLKAWPTSYSDEGLLDDELEDPESNLKSKKTLIKNFQCLS